jgi:NADH-quinone oxidoreductase subunit M
MSGLQLPWLELSIVAPLVGAALVSRVRDGEWAQRRSMPFFAVTLACAVGAWLEFNWRHVSEVQAFWDLPARILGDGALVIDELSAPLLPLVALLHLLTAVMTPRTKARRFSFAWTLASEAVLLATLSCKLPWAIILLLALGTVVPWIELRIRRCPTRVYVLHMALFVVLLVAGYGLATRPGASPAEATWGSGLLIAAVLLRSGIVPVHCWMTDLFEQASLGTALLFVTPMVGAYAAVRLVLPLAPDWALRSIAVISLFTAVYAAGMALVQREARRFFCYLFLSHSSLVLVGLESTTPIGLAGALSVWLSVGLALAGFGLTLRAIEARMGRLALDEYHGLYDQTPTLAAFFLLTGLASVGFPGTFGFAGTELLVEGAVQAYPLVGAAVVVAAALNGIAVLRAYFRLFTGQRHVAAVSLRCRTHERLAVLGLAFLILAGGLYPQPGIASRYHAATVLLGQRQGKAPIRPAPATDHADRMEPTRGGTPRPISRAP